MEGGGRYLFVSVFVPYPADGSGGAAKDIAKSLSIKIDDSNRNATVAFTTPLNHVVVHADISGGYEVLRGDLS